MAKKKAATETETETIRRPKSEDVHKAMADVSAAKKEAAEASGEAGSVVKNFCERWNTSKKAFGFARSLYDMDPAKRQSTIRDFLDLSRKLGFLDQKDLFNDVGDEAAKIEKQPDAAGIAAHLDAEDAGAAAAKGDGKVTPLKRGAREGAGAAAKAGDEHNRRVADEINGARNPTH